MNIPTCIVVGLLGASAGIYAEDITTSGGGIHLYHETSQDFVDTEDVVFVPLRVGTDGLEKQKFNIRFLRKQVCTQAIRMILAKSSRR